ncbi:selenocysteine-specific translation elongation factor [Microlunatus elymi]|uniref:Selenocysteine-specific translation elongation factor n=1 Tax=Microlunatus elymi TaxID=2596828 RepID=A0A516PY18_9ACTN|nr:selenocysteine-specific translation elongation factor [Microlunatus elymi]QDP96042.1 selenocysteine-specific translation elongation factor [Microlunatus elymi]
MHVIATAGHVDHGKSTLVRALTGMDPDRLAEEKRRGLTIELGYAWTTLDPEGLADPQLAFVDVPGHERFIATMLAGLGPSPAVMFVVAADEGWRQQSEDHLAAVDALGITDGLLVVSRSDLADPEPALAQAAARIAESSLGTVPAVAVSAKTGAGLPQLRTELAGLAGRLPKPNLDGRVRLWIDRCFSIRGAGTVITGTLGSGQLAVGDQLELDGRRVQVRALQSLGQDHQRVDAVARVAVNLRGVGTGEVGRGTALLTPGAWPRSAVVDVRCRAAMPPEGLPINLVGHLGTAAVPVRLRPLGGPIVRLTLQHPLPVAAGDRLVLRDPSRHTVAGGAIVLDVDPPELRRRGAARQRAQELLEREVAPDDAVLAGEVRRRGAVRRSELELHGVPVSDPGELILVDDWLVDPQAWLGWQQELRRVVGDRARTDPLDPTVTIDAVRHLIVVPDRQLIPQLVRASGLLIRDGRVTDPDVAARGLGAAELGLGELARQLDAAPFAAPTQPELDGWGLGRQELAAAERAGRIIRLTDEVVLLPAAPELAARILAELPQPFTAGEARQVLNTTRRVIIPLLEHLDRRGWTTHIDPNHRQVRADRPSTSDRPSTLG